MARHPESGEPILVNLGRYGPYVQHGKTYANLSDDDDVFAIGANRAIDLIVAKESGAGGGRRGRASDPGRALGDDPASGKPVVVKSGRYGPYVTDGAVNATLPKEMSADAVTLDEAVGLLRAREASGGGKAKRAPARGRKTAGAGSKPAKAAASEARSAKPGKPKSKAAKPKDKAGTTARTRTAPAGE